VMENSTYFSNQGTFLNDVCFDFYGRRFATSSGDSIKVWELDVNGEWKSKSGWEWRAHDAPILKLAWAYPGFGQVLISSSFDQTVRIWEEKEKGLGETYWALQATFQDSKQPVYDIECSPSHERFQVACASGDSMVRIYEAKDIRNLEEWVLEAIFPGDEIDVGITTLSWNPCRFDGSMLVIGTSNGSIKVLSLQLFKYFNNNSTIG